jgi:hypothetical protein
VLRGGLPVDFSRIAAPVLARATRQANRKDLERLKRLLEELLARPPKGGAHGHVEDGVRIGRHHGRLLPRQSGPESVERLRSGPTSR